MRKIVVFCLLLITGITFAQPAIEVKPAEVQVIAKTVPWITIQVKDLGNIVIELNPDSAPKNVANVESLARAGFYNGLTFHRVIEGFMIQGGDPAGDGTGGPGYDVDAEITGLQHFRGAMAMARLGDQANPQRRSSGSQFYICHADVHFLDNNYTVIGMTRAGMDVVDAIAKVERDPMDKPVKPVVMEKVTVELKPPTPVDLPSKRGPSFLNVRIKDYGNVKVELFVNDAPNNTGGIEDFARQSMYDGTTIRQVKPGFVIQLGDQRSEKGGCEGGGCGGCGAVAPETGKHKHVKGSVGVGVAANKLQPKTACEFYFCLADQPDLDDIGYTVIGQVVEGMAVLEKIAKVKTDAKTGKPVKPITIESVMVEAANTQD